MKGGRKEGRKGGRKEGRKEERKKERKKLTTRYSSNILYSCRISAVCVPGLSTDLEVS